MKNIVYCFAKTIINIVQHNLSYRSKNNTTKIIQNGNGLQRIERMGGIQRTSQTMVNTDFLIIN